MSVDAYKPGPCTNVECSPLVAKSLRGNPACYFQIAGRDPFRDESLLYAQRLEKEGIPIQVKVYVHFSIYTNDD